MPPEKPKPGDYLLNKYFPDADKEARELAREAFRDLALFFYRRGVRIFEARKRREATGEPEPVQTVRRPSRKEHPRRSWVRMPDGTLSLLHSTYPEDVT